MSGVAPGGASDFNQRLRQALSKAKAPAPPTAPAAAARGAVAPPGPATGGPASDEFNARLGSALRRARGESEPAVGETAPEGAAPSGGPVGSGAYVVRPGDCISSIAKEHGFFWQTIWDDPGNAELVAARGDPNVLLPDDRVAIPAKRRKEETIAPEQRHTFKRKGEPSKLKLRIRRHGRPVAGKPYELTVDGRVAASGTSDADGNVQIPIPGDAREGRLRIGDPGEEMEYPLSFGQLAPISELLGVQQRLYNLGYMVEQPNGQAPEIDEPTIDALIEFQRANELQVTGRPDQPTRDKLREVYGG